ncbi:MAG: tetratricopeptide repeat protein [Myxococcota bacterium]
MASSPHIIDVDSATFESDVVEKSREVPVVVDFWAPWCGPCRTLGPTLEALADEAGGDWILAKVNVDDNQQLAQQFNVRGIPAVKAFVDGAVADEFTGAKPRNAVELWLENFMPSKADADIKEGREAEAAGDEARAAEAYRRALEDDPNHTEALVGLSRIEFARGDREAAAELLERVLPGTEGQDTADFQRAWFQVEAADLPDVEELEERVDSDGSNLTARWELAVKLAADQQYDEALEQLLQIVIRDRDFREDIGRETMVRIFHVLGPQSDRTRQWQKKLGRAMY